jgi:hypothetical protein
VHLALFFNAGKLVDYSLYRPENRMEKGTLATEDVRQEHTDRFGERDHYHRKQQNL